LDFDEFEDEYLATKNQRFYGFKQISFKSNALDDSYLRKKVVADIFRETGVVSSQTAFYEVYVDIGEGPQYFGLYTAVEIVDDTVIQTQFTDDGGNVYKPDGNGAAFLEGTFNEGSFEKQTNQDEADWSDIQAVFQALHSELRTRDPEAWRAELEAVFNVDAFIRWLAADTIIQNWDTYGAMAYNYYLYTDPADGLVTWIPWDNNMVLEARSMGPGDRNNRGGPGGSVRELDLSSVSDQWPLIRFLMDDPIYLAKYQQDLEETIQSAFQPETWKLSTQNITI
jgi:spore coat protein H